MQKYDANTRRGLNSADVGPPRKLIIGVIMAIALLAFEVFNFDTTQYALSDLLGPVKFFNVSWATILAVAFCSIDFAGLARLFTPEDRDNEPQEVWYLMAAWLLGATLNAVMTWWAVTIILLGQDLGNEILTRDQILQAVPIFVAVLVWLTRILFIGSFSNLAGDLFASQRRQRHVVEYEQAQPVQQVQDVQVETMEQRVRMTPRKIVTPRPKPKPTRNVPVNNRSTPAPMYAQGRELD